MPGRDRESLEQSFLEMRQQGVTLIVRLTSLDEVQQKSPDYYRALEERLTPCQVEECPVPDFGIPEDERYFIEVVQRSADRLTRGEKILVHCGAGIGRTSMFAILTLVVLGMPLETAEQAVRRAGSTPESDEQREFISRVGAALRK